MSKQTMVKSAYLFDEKFSVLYHVMFFSMLKIPVRINAPGKSRHRAVDFSFDF